MTHDLILFLQDIRLSSDTLTSAMVMVSNPAVYMVAPIVAAAFIFWFVDKRQGDWIIMNMVCGGFIGHFLKNLLMIPRPWVSDDRVLPEDTALKHADGYSTPSGHSVESTTGYGSLAILIRKWWISVIFAAIIITVMFSRLFLGVHTLLDLVFGFILAVTVIVINHCLLKTSYNGRYAVVSLCYIAAFTVIALIWSRLTTDYKGLFGYGGLAFGTLVGRLVEHEFVRYDIKEMTIMKKIERFLLGLVVCSILFLVPYILINGDYGLMTSAFLAAIGFFTIVPIMFKKMDGCLLDDSEHSL